MKKSQFLIFLSQKDKTELERLSIKRKESKSAVIRKLINIEKYAKTLEQIEIYNKINAEFLYQISKIGNNLNQIAYQLNIDITRDNEAKNSFAEMFENFKTILQENREKIEKEHIDLNIKQIKTRKIIE